MKIQVRKNIFETNSSSTHSLVVGNNGENVYDNLPKTIHFDGGEFGWDVDEYHNTENKANYIFTVAVNCNIADEFIEKVTKILNKWDIIPTFAEIEEKSWTDIDGNKHYYKDFTDGYYYVDHSYNAVGFVSQLLENEDLLMNFLFSDASLICTGNDNDEADYPYPSKYPEHIMLNYKKTN